MKKKFIIMILALILLIPFKVNAASIKSTAITGLNNVTVGENVSITFYINFDGFDKTSTSSLGLWGVEYQLIFDQNVLEPIEITSSNFDSEIYKDGNQYVVSSVVGDNISASDKCIDGISYCSNYSVTIDFNVKDTTTTTTTIEMGSMSIYLLPMLDSNKTYTENEILNNITIESATSNSIKTINITQKTTSNNSSNNNNSNSSNSSNNNDTTNNNQNNNDTNEENDTEVLEGSDNNYLKKLEIENYSIEFDRYKKDYGLVIDENINSLTIKVELEDDKATYEIIGADDLKANNYETKIIVTAENSKQRTYTIYSRFEDESAVNEEIIIEDKEEEKESSFQLTQQQLIIITIIGGVLLIIIILIAIFIHKKNRKLEKVLNNL